MNLYTLTIHEAALLLQKREISSQELIRSILNRIKQHEDKIGAYITVAEASAMEQARKADERIARGDTTVMTGIPVAVKDLICTQGIPTTCGSKILEGFIPPYDATVIRKLKESGAVILGKLNMDEFAMGSSTEYSAFKPTRNPWDLSCIPGGSSGGAAAAVSADMCLGSLGSDTGGSIRQPASHCGVVGMKPTYGRVSRYGLVAFASSLDQIGPITKSVRDNAILMNFIAGHDPYDSTSVPRPVPDFCRGLDEDLKGIVIGIPKEYESSEGLHPNVLSAINNAIKTMEGMGATCIGISLPHTAYAVAAYYVIAPSEASSNLARYDGVKYGFRDPESNDLLMMYKRSRSAGFGVEVQRRIIIGTYCLSAGYYDAYYRKASQVRTLIIEDYKKAFQKCRIILSPVAPTPAFKIGEKVEDPLTMYLSDIFTLSANLAGIPGISIPCGFSAEGLPIGLQLLGKHFDEEGIYQTAYQFEKATEFHFKKPKI
jgi:aspartyl-tRNA(Asn)/glutamyl-tRNA(Gln) amidotransferase subunit A